MKGDWAGATAICDDIFDMLNDKLQAGFRPAEAIAGQLLALKAFMNTPAGMSLPVTMAQLIDTVDECLADIAEDFPEGPRG